MVLKTTKHCKVEIVALSKFSCMCSKSSNAAVSSGKRSTSSMPPHPRTLQPPIQLSWRVMPVSTVPVHGKEGNASKHGNGKYFSENLAYYAPTMLILKPQLFKTKCRRTLLAIANTMTSVVSTTLSCIGRNVLTFVDGDLTNLFPCSHKEADTCLLLHVADAVQKDFIKFKVYMYAL